MKRLIFSLAWLIVSLSTFAQVFEGTVVKVLDGDTYDVEVNGSKLRCRLMNVDAPEKDGSGRPSVLWSKCQELCGESFVWKDVRDSFGGY